MPLHLDRPAPGSTWRQSRSARPDGLRGLAAGMLAGLAASAVMNGFQALTDLAPSGGEPATEKAANRVSTAATGKPVAEDRRAAAGSAVHYAFGAAIGGAYGLAAESWPGVTAGGGSGFGATAALLFDEIAVPALGLGPPPDQSPPATHAYALASHLVFGFAAEAVRRALRG